MGWPVPAAPWFTSKVAEPDPLAGPTVMPRFALIAKLFVVCNVPPLITMRPAVGEELVAPRLASENTVNVPALIVTAPGNVFVAASVTWPPPGRVRPAPAGPPIGPRITSE